MTLPLTGGCQCGHLRYSINTAPRTLYCCHCTECQAQSASAFGMSLRVDTDAVTLEGRYSSFTRDAGKPNAVECIFCPLCGTRIMHRGRGKGSGSSIKAGSLDDKTWLHPVGHIWTASAQKWVIVEGLTYERQPDDSYAALSEAFRKRHGFRFL
ncbi:MAG: GFA family protein [Pseudomonadota bacterium]